MELTKRLLKKEEVLRYLGYQGSEIPKNTEQLIESCILETLSLVRPTYVYRKFSLEPSAKGIVVSGANFCLTGKDIEAHLAGCKEAYLLCATVGGFVDKNIRLKMVMEPAAGVVLDSCGSVAVERVAEAAEQEIERAEQEAGRYLTWRFSPGYGDLPLMLQRDFAEALDTHRRLGVGVSESQMLVPSKSVTAIIGVMESPEEGGLWEEVQSGRNTRIRGISGTDKCERCMNRERCNLYFHGSSCGSRENK